MLRGRVREAACYCSCAFPAVQHRGAAQCSGMMVSCCTLKFYTGISLLLTQAIPKTPSHPPLSHTSLALKPIPAHECETGTLFQLLPLLTLSQVSHPVIVISLPQAQFLFVMCVRALIHVQTLVQLADTFPKGLGSILNLETSPLLTSKLNLSHYLTGYYEL